MNTVSPQTLHEAQGVSEVRILKIASCLSLSGKSTLTYHVGCNDESDILARVFTNSNGGFFSNEWVSLSMINQAFEKVSDNIPITAHLLSPLFQGKSANTPAFLFAVLKGEGLVRPLKDKKGCYERNDGKDFYSEVMGLMAANVNLSVPEKNKEKPSVKEKASEVKAATVKARKVKPGRK